MRSAETVAEGRMWDGHRGNMLGQPIRADSGPRLSAERCSAASIRKRLVPPQKGLSRSYSKHRKAFFSHAW